jgi:hypothetical protein
MRKSILEKYGGTEGLIREVEGNPEKYSRSWSKPWTAYTWRELLELWTPDTTKPN